MPTIGKPKPRFLKFVTKPTSVGNVELSKAEPVYIDGLPAGTSDSVVSVGVRDPADPNIFDFPDGTPLTEILVEAYQTLIGLSDRLEVLENPGG